MNDKAVVKKEEKLPQATNSLPAAVIQAQLYGNWAGTTEDQRVKACLELCGVLGIPTPLNPFRFITLNGKMVMYAPNEAAQLIAASREASVDIVNKYRDKETNIYVVEIQVSTQARRVQNFAAIYVGGLTGQKLADAMMKCCTKGIRRTIFGAFGLSIADDDDVAANSPPPAPLKIQASEVIEAYTAPVKPENVDLQEATIEARSGLFRRLIGKDSMFGKEVGKAKAWVEDMTDGVPLEQLTIDNCATLEGWLDEADAQKEDPTPVDISEAESKEAK